MQVNYENYQELLRGLKALPLNAMSGYWSESQANLLADWYTDNHEGMDVSEAVQRSAYEWTSYKSPSDAAFNHDMTFNSIQEETTVLECNDRTVLVLEF